MEYQQLYCFRSITCRSSALTASTGTAKDMLLAATAVRPAMPTTWPCRSTRGPPELPELTARSVWM